MKANLSFEKRKKMNEFRMLTITARRICISTISQCMCICEFQLYKVLMKNIFEHGIKLHNTLLQIQIQNSRYKTK